MLNGHRIITHGHYISMPRGATQAQMLIALEKPGVIGIQVRYPWRDLELSHDNYDFRQVAWDSMLAYTHGKKLVAMIEDKTFTPENPIPDYLSAHAIRNTREGYTGARWRPEFMVRMRCVADALYRMNLPGFGGIAFQETALGIELDKLEGLGYTAERYEIMMKALSWSCDFLYVNYIPQGQARLKNVIEQCACAVGGPDILPSSDELLRQVYPHFEDAPNGVVTFSSMQFDSFRHMKPDGKLWPLEEMVEWACKTLRVRTIFWNMMTWGEDHTIENAWPIIAARPRL